MNFKLTAAFLLVAISVHAQQRPQYTQYVLNNYIINPAVAGIENYWDLKISHRHQWVGLDGAPVTTYLTIQGPLRKNDYERETATSLHPEGENPRGEAYWNQYQSTDPHAGIGFTLLNDRTGPLNRFSFYGSYAYHIPVSDHTSLSAGISAGIQNSTLNTNSLYFGEDHPVDPAVYGGGYLKTLSADINAGLWLYSANYFLGLAAQNIIPSKLAFAEDTLTLRKGKYLPHLFLQVGYKMLVADNLSFLPSVMIKSVSGTPVSFDVNGKLQYRDFFWVGASYRYKDSYSAMAGISVSSVFNFSYAYDVTISKLSAVSGASHELVVGFMLGNRYGDWCPRNIW